MKLWRECRWGDAMPLLRVCRFERGYRESIATFVIRIPMPWLEWRSRHYRINSDQLMRGWFRRDVNIALDQYQGGIALRFMTGLLPMFARPIPYEAVA